MRIRLWLTAALFATLLPAAARAEIKIVVVDVQRIISTSDAGRSAKEKLKAEFESRKKTLDGLRDEVKSMKEELDKQGAMLSEDARKVREKELEDKQRKFLDEIKANEDALQQKDQELTVGVLKDLEDVILEMGKEENYDLILEKGEGNVLYASEAVDITERVITRYNAFSKKPRIPTDQVNE